MAVVRALAGVAAAKGALNMTHWKMMQWLAMTLVLLAGARGCADEPTDGGGSRKQMYKGRN
jgi:hypothetical protein